MSSKEIILKNKDEQFESSVSMNEESDSLSQSSFLSYRGGVNDSDSELISVVIPVYNGAKYLPHFLESLNNQTYSNFEVIFGYDKKSTDNSHKILEEYKQKYSKKYRIVIDKGCDNGTGGGRNRGLLLTKGKYIAFLDGDDYLMPQYLEYLHDAFIQYPEISVSSCRCLAFDDDVDINMKNEIANASKHEITIYSNKEMIDIYTHMSLIDNVSNPVIQFPTVWIYLIKKDILLENNLIFQDSGLQKDGILEDIVWVLQLFNCVEKVAFTSKILYFYYIHESSLKTSSDMRTILDCTKNTCAFISSKISPDNHKLVDDCYNMIIPFVLYYGALAESYISWYNYLREIFSVHENEINSVNSVESIKLTSVVYPPISPIENMFINVFNSNKHMFYVLCRMWECKEIQSDEELQMCFDLVNLYPKIFAK